LLDSVELLSKLANQGDGDAIRETLHSLARRSWTRDEVVDLTDVLVQPDDVQRPGTRAS
jgi:hypothetical protein